MAISLRLPSLQELRQLLWTSVSTGLIWDHVWDHQRYMFACEQVPFFDFHELLDGLFFGWESGSRYQCLEASPQHTTLPTAIIACMVYACGDRSLLLLLTSVLLRFRLNIPMAYSIVFFL